MKRSQEFLDGSLPLPGMAACSVRLADRTFVSRCYSDWFTSAQVEQALEPPGAGRRQPGLPRHPAGPAVLGLRAQPHSSRLAPRRRLPRLVRGEPAGRHQPQTGSRAGGVHKPLGGGSTKGVKKTVQCRGVSRRTAHDVGGMRDASLQSRAAPSSGADCEPSPTRSARNRAGAWKHHRPPGAVEAAASPLSRAVNRLFMISAPGAGWQKWTLFSGGLSSRCPRCKESDPASTGKGYESI